MATVNQVVEAITFALNQQLEQIRFKLDTVAQVKKMSDEEKYSYLFDLWDRNGDGVITFAELVGGLVKCTPDSLETSVKNALQGLFAYDTDRDQQLDLDEFKEFINDFCEALGADFHDVAVLLMLQFSDTLTLEDEQLMELLESFQDTAVREVAKAQELYDNATDPRMNELFELFDRDHDDRISFKELALALQKLDVDSPLDESAEAAVGALLLYSEDDPRSLNYAQFSRFISAFCHLVKTPFDILVDQLIELESTQVDQRRQSAILTAVEKVMDEAQRIAETAVSPRLNLLFDLWDSDKDGTLSFKELALGLRAFEPARPLSDTAVQASAAMIKYDAEHNRTLNRTEFASFIVDFARAVETEIEELEDFLIVVSVMNPASSQDEAVLTAAEVEIDKAIAESQDALDSQEAQGAI